MSSTRRPKRIGFDNYQTPFRPIRTLEKFLTESAPSFGGKHLLEPCRGNGNITTVFSHYFDTTIWSEIREGHDYLTTDFTGFRPDWIITNPPFSLGLQFLKKSLRECPNVVYLLRLNFLASHKRMSFWQSHQPDALLVLADRPSFTGDGKTDSIDYAWFIWSKDVPNGIFVL